MGTVLVTLLAMLLFVAFMAVGVMFGRKPLTGSCGGVGKALGEKEYVCDICGGDESKCEEKQQSALENKTADKSDLAYEVSAKK